MKNKHNPGRPKKWSNRYSVLGNGDHKLDVNAIAIHGFDVVKIFPGAQDLIQKVIDTTFNLEQTTVERVVNLIVSQSEADIRRNIKNVRGLVGITPMRAKIGRHGNLQCEVVMLPLLNTEDGDVLVVMTEPEHEEIRNGIVKECGGTYVPKGDFDSLKKQFKKEVPKDAPGIDQMNWWRNWEQKD